MMSNRAVCYLRSSKDRSDVSIDAQRRALHEMAAARSLVVVGEFVDAVESGKDDDRPGFQSMLAALKAPGRAWETVLALDTARIARRRIISLIFEEQECRRKGVRVLYKSVPESDPVTEMLTKSILQAFDEWHSLTSKAKGLAGMAENVRQGWRAGGRAPRGYQLEYVPTGAIREGVAVTKSRLIVGDDAPVVAAYLRARAAGELRGAVLRRLGLTWATASIVGLEWQALTYAGHTVWNMHAERDGSTAVGGSKRRPRREWIIQRGTHEALISDDEAEALLARLQARSERYTRARTHDYLLTGLLVSETGISWNGENGSVYRLRRGKKVSCARVDGTVLDRIAEDLQTPAAVATLLAGVRRLAEAPSDGKRIAQLERAIAAATAKVGRLVDLTAKADDPTPYLRRVTELEGEREGLVAELSRQRAAVARGAAAGQISERDVRAMLRTVLEEVRHQREEGAVAALRSALAGMIERIELDSAATRCTLHYRLELTPEEGGQLWRPQGDDGQPPVLRWSNGGPLRKKWA